MLVQFISACILSCILGHICVCVKNKFVWDEEQTFSVDNDYVPLFLTIIV